MVRIKTKRAVLYDVRENKYGVLVLQMEIKKYAGGYSSTITDFVEREIQYIPPSVNAEEGVPAMEASTEPLTRTYLEQIGQKHINISHEEINTLFGMIDHMVPNDLPYFEREDELHRQAFLVYVQNDFIKNPLGEKIQGKTIYNLNQDDWEIVR